jgi:hypothetical protein
MNSKSAGGPDGIGVPVFKKFWPFIRRAMSCYSTEMMRLGLMSPSFLTSSISLIPKKGDTSKIKNWRPISLLNVGYNIISKAINNRLKKVSERILGRPQKGFTSNRNIQECLMNIIEAVAYCQDTKTKGFLLAIDQAKAFDTVSHEFVMQVYKFFGFGDRFINMLNIATMGRNATIILENNSLSSSFLLKTGFQQGNGPSPLQFNFCEQIFLLKLEFDPDITAIKWLNNKFDVQVAGNRQIEPQQQQQQPQLQHPQHLAQQEGVIPQDPAQQGKVESFADDATVLALANQLALARIKIIMDQFASMSGLKANFDKCVLVPLGFDNEIPQYFADTGFFVANSVKILGCQIFNDTGRLSENFDDVIAQLIKIKNFWARFNLSLPGRIAVAKTLMLSKLSYLGCVLNPDPDQLNEINNIITNFIKGKLNISIEKITAPPDQGGLGMINIVDFLTGIKIAWVLRAKNIKDMWAITINACNMTCPVPSPGIHVEGTVTIANIKKAVDRFAYAFHSYKKNILLSKVLHNPLLSRAGIQTVSIEDVPLPDRQLLLDLKFSDLILNGVPFTRRRISEEFASLRQQDREKIFLALRFAIRFVKSDLDPDPVEPPKTINDAIFKVKKGSKSYRRYLTVHRNGEKILNLNSIRKFFSSVDLTLPDPLQIRSINNFWTSSFLPNKFKEFLYKLHNNLIGLNSRVAHFNQYIGPECTFALEGNGFQLREKL